MVGKRNMRPLKQGLILHPVVEVACFVVPNKEDRCSEQATCVCAFLNQFHQTLVSALSEGSRNI